MRLTVATLDIIPSGANAQRPPMAGADGVGDDGGPPDEDERHDQGERAAERDAGEQAGGAGDEEAPARDGCPASHYPVTRA